MNSLTASSSQFMFNRSISPFKKYSTRMVNQAYFSQFCFRSFLCKIGPRNVNYPFDQLYFLFLLARLGFSWNVTKRVTKQKVKPKKFISENFVVSRTRDTSIQIFTRATPLVVRKIVNLSSKGTATHMSEASLSTLPSFFTPTFMIRVCMDRQRAYADVITKFSSMDRFPFSIGMGGPLRKARADAPLKQTKTIHDDH